MNEQHYINYNRIAEAIEYIKNNFKQQPNLDEVAEQVHLSPFHFQRLFSEWAGTTPKKFLQYISVEYAKKLKSDRQHCFAIVFINTFAYYNQNLNYGHQENTAKDKCLFVMAPYSKLCKSQESK